MNHNIEINDLNYYAGDYDLDGLIRVADSVEAAFVFMEQDEMDDKYYRNRYTNLEPHMSLNNIIKSVHYYLEQDELNSLFISFAVEYEGKLTVFDGREEQYEGLELGELELGENLIYGLIVQLVDEAYSFKEVLYKDGGLKQQSEAVPVFDAGELRELMGDFIMQFM